MRPILVLLVCFAPMWAADTVVTYGGGSGSERFTTALRCSDGTWLVGGTADDLGWIGAAVPRLALGGIAGDGEAMPANGSQTAFILHLTANLGTILRCASFPVGLGGSLRAIKTDSAPGATTGSLYLSGTKDADEVWYGKLNANFITAQPSGLQWIHQTRTGNLSDLHHAALWDVGGDGRIVYYHYLNASWGVVYRLAADGSALDNPSAWWDFSEGGRGISLKPGNGCLRSTNAADYAQVSTHSWTAAITVGSVTGVSKKRGRFPFDYYYSSWKGDAASSDGGYTGYSSDGKTATTVAVAIDRRDNTIYLGWNTGNPQNTHDFEPCLAAFAPTDGTMRWYSRMKPEWIDADGDDVVDAGEAFQSSPDHYVDGMAIDYSKPVGAPEVVVLARSHGNNTANFYGGGLAGGSSYHNGFSGTNGNEHMGWIGRFRGDTGTFVDATWHTEFDPWGDQWGAAYAQPELDGWPSHNAGWPDLKTTKSRCLSVDSQGNPALVATSRGPLTTSDAWQKMPRPLPGPNGQGRGPWADFVRTYRQDFTSLVYSSAVTGSFTPADGNGGDNITLEWVVPTADGVLVVGYHVLDSTTGATKGAAMTTYARPAWGGTVPTKEQAVLAFLAYGSGSSAARGVLSFDAATYAVSEGASGTTTATITVTRSGGSTGPVGVSFATASGSATAGSDYTATAGTLAWADGETASKSFAVAISGDTTIESDESVQLSLSSATGGASLGAASAALVITNDDLPPAGTIAFSSTASSSPEGTVSATITVTRSGGSAGAVGVSYATAPGTATAGADYTSAAGTLSWAAGASGSRTFTVTVIGDTLTEANETVALTLSNATGGAVLGLAGATLTILDDDTPGPGGGAGGAAGVPSASGGGGCGSGGLGALAVLICAASVLRLRK